MKKVTLVIIALAFGLAAHADTLTFVAAGDNIAGAYYAYPYYFSINGSTSLTPMMCISYDQEITVKESWQAVAEAVATKPELEAAWLLQDAQDNPSNASNDNLAAWGLFSTDVPTDPASDAQFALSASGYASINPGDFVIYVPVDGTQTSGGTPQIFIGKETPEPFSLLLVGSGLAGLAFMKRRMGYAK
jgi:hypothetical protein